MLNNSFSPTGVGLGGDSFFFKRNQPTGSESMRVLKTEQEVRKRQVSLVEDKS